MILFLIYVLICIDILDCISLFLYSNKIILTSLLLRLSISQELHAYTFLYSFLLPSCCVMDPNHILMFRHPKTIYLQYFVSNLVTCMIFLLLPMYDLSIDSNMLLDLLFYGMLILDSLFQVIHSNMYFLL